MSDGAAACIEALAASGLESATSGGSDSAVACIEALAAPGLQSATSVGSDSAAAYNASAFSGMVAGSRPASHSSGVSPLVATEYGHCEAACSGAAAHSKGAQLTAIEWHQRRGRLPEGGSSCRWHGTLNHAMSGFGGEKGSEGGGGPPRRSREPVGDSW